MLHVSHTEASQSHRVSHVAQRGPKSYPSYACFAHHDHAVMHPTTEKANDGITIPLWIAFPMTTPFFCLHLMNHVNKLLFLY